MKRVVGPQFFVEDGLMLVLAAIAGRWARPSGGLRSASVILGAVIVFAFVSYGVAAARHGATRAPVTITVDGRPYSIARGRFFCSSLIPSVRTAWMPPNRWRNSIGTTPPWSPFPSMCRSIRRSSWPKAD